MTGERRAHHGMILVEATKIVEAGAVTHALGPRRFTLARVSDACRAIADGMARGKSSADVGEGASA